MGLRIVHLRKEHMVRMQSRESKASNAETDAGCSSIGNSSTGTDYFHSSTGTDYFRATGGRGFCYHSQTFKNTSNLPTNKMRKTAPNGAKCC
eukprot:890545-Amphidinium_carterae.1